MDIRVIVARIFNPRATPDRVWTPESDHGKQIVNENIRVIRTLDERLRQELAEMNEALNRSRPFNGRMW